MPAIKHRSYIHSSFRTCGIVVINQLYIRMSLLLEEKLLSNDDEALNLCLGALVDIVDDLLVIQVDNSLGER